MNDKLTQKKFSYSPFKKASQMSSYERVWSITTFYLGIVSLLFVIVLADSPVQNLISPLGKQLQSLYQMFEKEEKEYARFSFVPGWSPRKLDDVIFRGLTTISYFDIPLNGDGSIDQENDGYANLTSDVFGTVIQSAHANNVKVMLTVTQTSNPAIRQLLSDKTAQQRAIDETLAVVKEVGADGITIDIEYTGENGATYREGLNEFVGSFKQAMERDLPHGQINIALSTSVDENALYDVATLAKHTDHVFLMAYDFAVPEQQDGKALAPKFGYKEEDYWTDFNTKVEKIAAHIPAEKMVLERAWYGNGDHYPFYQSLVNESNHTVKNRASINTLQTPLSATTIERLIVGVPTKAKAAARKNLPLIAEALEQEGILNQNVLAYALATIEHETAGTFEPLEEFKGRKSARRLGYEGGTNYFGRGFIQLTHLRNYQMMGERIGLEDKLVRHPELGSDPKIAAKVLAAFFKDNGIATLASKGSFVAARKPVNPDMQGSWIASLAWKYLDNLG